ncbi:MAG: hypothetical protein R2932_14740 [Caldilineaceae bacterium]
MHLQKRLFVLLTIMLSLLIVAAGRVAYAAVYTPYAQEEDNVVASAVNATELLVFEVNRDVVLSDRGFPRDHPPKDAANGNWTSPINYAEGTLYYRIQIRNQPKPQDMQLQFCVWQDSFNLENCGDKAKLRGTAGTVVTWSEPVASMWKLNGRSIDWTRARQRYALAIKNKSGRPVSPANGWNWNGENTSDWFPFDIRFTVVVVAKGATFSGWQNYGGSGGGGGNPPTPTPAPTNTPVPPPPSGEGTIYLSSSSNGTVSGVNFSDEDILGHDLATGRWWKLFDGSDVGITRDINGFTFLNDGSLLFTLNAPTNVADVGLVDDSDIVRFIPSALGDTTSGRFTLYFDGSDVELSTNGEDLDAISVLPDGSLLLSVLGAMRAGGVLAKDEDVVRFIPTALGANTAGQWELYFDGSAVGLTKGSEDIWSAFFDAAKNDLYLSTQQSFSVANLSGRGEDIFVCNLTKRGADTTCLFRPFWAGAAHGFQGEQIDGMFIGAGPQVAVNVASEPEDEALIDVSEFADDDVMEDENGEELEVVSTVYLPIMMR